MNKSALRWSLLALIVVVGMIYALWPRDTNPGLQPPIGGLATGQGPTVGSAGGSVDSIEGLASLRERAQLEPCPTPDPGSPAPAGPLTGIVLECVSDGSSIDVGQALAGKPALINLWAYWCGPCAEELPYLQQYADSVADRLTVLTVHQDRNEGNGLAKLADYGVSLPGVQDEAGRIAAAVGAPPVLPVSILIDADGNVAKVLPQPFRSVEEIADAVENDLGLAR
ncbi:TlpA disulfide reductase family protein [Rhodococcus sp. H29-C3]|uniref:TlpA family protein disulfide reductase n=1 Tax=Rhodococcus sp. H29-C3 TaxID=3046307 RepID=UPI0024B88158|nr:TlpA disulfide reductase family protein [Rhodococcus sp. H29-C3]MDJ0359346.1 TlpA disulfide reductase family protein [Rhodococcus sp. H29-C3]